MTQVDRSGHYPHFASLSDEKWLSILERSVKEPVVDGIEFPRFPPDALQSQFVGSSNDNALREAHVFFSTLKAASREMGNPLSGDSRILDFGCGWGRFLRFFWKDVRHENIHGVDIDPDILEVCRSCGVPGDLSPITALGKLKFPDGHFSHVMAYSVFTHLPQEVHLHWMIEIARVIRPGGTFALTLEPRRFLDFVLSLESEASASLWHATMAKFAPNVPAYKAAFDRGDMAYLPTGGGDHRHSDIYGEAVVPLEFIRRRWSQYFEVVDYIDDPKRFWQAALIVRRL